MKVIVNGEETEIETRDDLFIKIGDEWYVKTINIEKQILTELEEWLEMMEEKETIGTYSMVQEKIQKLRKKYGE